MAMKIVELSQTEIAARSQTLAAKIAERCSNLNDAGDSILWKGATLTDYANELFDTESDSWQKLDAEKKEVLLGDLTGRPDEINERAATASPDEPDTVEGEAVEETEAAFNRMARSRRR